MKGNTSKTRFLFFGLLRHAVLRLSRTLRPLYGGFGLRSRTLELMPQFVPNSGSWQIASKKIALGINELPRLLTSISKLNPRRQPQIAPLMRSDKDLEAKLYRLFLSHKSDKARNGYSHLYSSLLSTRLAAENDILIVEIGIGSTNPLVPSTMAHADSVPGSSLRAFRDLGENVTVIGLDVDPEVLFEEARISTFCLDQMEEKSLNSIALRLGSSSVDLLIDDGFHFVYANLASILSLYSSLKPGGYFVVEDIPARSREVWLLAQEHFRRAKIACLLEEVRPGLYAFLLQRPS